MSTLGILASAMKRSTLLLDQYPGAGMALSLRKLRAAYTGACIRVSRTSDNTEQDIGFVSNLLDTTTLASFVGASTGTVVTWYDQSGNGYDVKKDPTINAPEIRVSGVNQSLNGKISIYYNAPPSYKLLVSPVSCPNILEANGSFIAFGVGNSVDTTTIRVMVSVQGTLSNSQAIRKNASGVLESIAFNSGGTFTDVGGTLIATNQFIACTERNVSSIEIFTNKNSNGATAATGTANSGRIPLLGYITSPVNSWYGHMQEVIIYALDPTSNTTYKTTVSDAINSYYLTY
jgi:hypothetical protein